MSQTVTVLSQVQDRHVLFRAAQLFSLNLRMQVGYAVVTSTDNRHSVRVDLGSGAISFDGDFQERRELARMLGEQYMAAQLVMAAEQNGWSYELSSAVDSSPVVTVDMPEEATLEEVSLV